VNVRSKIMLADGESHEWGLSAECIRQCSVMELYRISPQMSASVPGSHDRVVQKIGYWDDYQDSPSELGHKQTPNVCTVKQNRVFQALSR
jgi:hypothetical protein